MQYRMFISPYFAIRYYLLRDLASTLKQNNFKGTLIDIGCGEKPYLSLFKSLSSISSYKGIDFDHYSINKDFSREKPDYYFNKNYKKNYLLPFQNEEFDNAVAFQVLEHHANPNLMIQEMFRITKKNGFILITVPFLGGIHEEPNDFQRFTKYGLEEIFSKYKCKIISIKEQGSVFSTISMLINEYLNDFASKNKLQYCLSLIIYPALLIFQYLSIILDIFFKSKKIFFNYLILIKKL